MGIWVLSWQEQPTEQNWNILVTTMLFIYNQDPRRGAWVIWQEKSGEASPSPSYHSSGADGPPENLLKQNSKVIDKHNILSSSKKTSFTGLVYRFLQP